MKGKICWLQFKSTDNSSRSYKVTSLWSQTVAVHVVHELFHEYYRKRHSTNKYKYTQVWHTSVSINRDRLIRAFVAANWWGYLWQFGQRRAHPWLWLTSLPLLSCSPPPSHHIVQTHHVNSWEEHVCVCVWVSVCVCRPFICMYICVCLGYRERRFRKIKTKRK